MIPRVAYGPLFLIILFCLAMAGLFASAGNLLDGIGTALDVATVVAALAGTALLVLTTYMCNLPGRSFPMALGDMLVPFCSGCANLTMLYIYFIAAFYFFRAAVLSVAGLKHGRAWTQTEWLRMYGGEEAVNPPSQPVPPRYVTTGSIFCTKCGGQLAPDGVAAGPDGQGVVPAVRCARCNQRFTSVAPPAAAPPPPPPLDFDDP
ncbi:MAG: hypothetical protein NT029_01580 [Armatimonadetes bacterium]|nr:hypothetical protein [Armatimonadota bacterium]